MGSARWGVEGAASAALRGVKAVAGFLRRWDKDALERAEGEARKAERRLREAIDVLPEGIVFLDGDGRYILWNKRYAEIYHRSADLFAPGRRLEDTLRIGVARGDYPDAVGREEAWITERLALMKNPGIRHEQRVSDGRWLMIEERATSDGGVIGLRVDITEMKEQAQALRLALGRAEAANKAKSDFLANLSHEILTPLNGVLGLAEALHRGELDAEQRDIVSTIIGSAGVLNELLGDLLTYSSLETGKLELQAAPVRLDDLILAVADQYRPAAEAKGLALVCDIAPRAGGEVMGDGARLRQILCQLVSNAVKFTAEGQVTLRLRLEGSGGLARRVIEVADTGVGFDPVEADRLFRKFEQGDGSFTRRFGGAGLGLAICRQLVELMGGAIRAQGRPGRGATFTVELPLEPVEAMAPAPEPAATEDAGPVGLKVLVVEDNPTNRKVAELMLSALGAEAECVENGQMAVEAVRGSPYDVALMDLQMPVMDGLTAIRCIRGEEAESGRQRLPIVVVSANVAPENMAAARAAGADGHIGKPIRAEELVAAISEAVGGGEAGIARAV
jgi:signal transduction histidine kinase/ActR/RegA family two-component response regulator